jgi:predicted ATPase
VKFHIENFGKVRQADIRLDGITVITGENGSGKSTISRALTTWCSVLRRMDEFVTLERLKSLRDGVNAVLEKHDKPKWDVALSVTSIAAMKRVLMPEFWTEAENIKWAFFPIARYRRFVADDEALVERIVNEVLSCKDEIFQVAEKLASRSDESYYPTIFTDRFCQAFGRTFLATVVRGNADNVAIVSDTEKRRAVSFRDGEVASVDGIGGNHLPRVFYIEPVHLLDFGSALDYEDESVYRPSRIGLQDRYSAGELNWRNVLYGGLNDSDWSLERKQRQREIEKELDKIVEAIHGRLSRERHELRFNDSDLNGSVSIGNIASGAKTMAMIEQGIRNGYMESGSVLVIDEPESNLHPEWQIVFARFLVSLCARFEIRILLNTHSPFFLKAIRTYSDLFEIGEKCAYYNMEKQNNDKLHTAMQKDEKSIEEVFADMARPYARLIYGENYDSKKLFG